MRAICFLWNIIWGFPQSLIGFVLFLGNIRKPHKMYHSAVVTEWNYGGSVSLGIFMFVSRGRRELYCHEYGHTVQSMMLGPLYLPIIGLPSVIWAGFPPLCRYRVKRQMSYYRLYTERWANFLGGRFTGEKPPK